MFSKEIDHRLSLSEQQKYQKMWLIDDYRKSSPGENLVRTFLLMSRPDTVIDFGAGTGRAAKTLQDKGYQVTAVDIAPNALETNVPFVHACLWEDLDLHPAVYGYCTDVMEHIPTEKVDAVLANITELCEYAFFNISFQPDNFGKRINDTLHLTVRPFEWWTETLSKHGKVIESSQSGNFYLRCN